ncbi:N-acyl-D-amino-acid deacylase family protein [Sphingosinicella rhizophila]|uniref:D-aminoacylase n=1 Tax=Sphingosinicella rhizophila TaxID=3050082 RepID=A0ABU3Q5K2_9SPHN|nr:D-aminoacylase [Sphingosinicella sp. GR2756]MDT9598686.1 D-aminoacylase [Sphingosinicella sp. GR2756]
MKNALILILSVTWMTGGCVQNEKPKQAAVAPVAGNRFDVLITNATIYDGSGTPPYPGEVAIDGDRIAFVGAKAPAAAGRTIDARGQAVAPGFINMLSHSRETILQDGRAMNVVMQGVTLEVNSETSNAPLTEKMRQRRMTLQGDTRTPVPWTTIGGYLDHVEKSGVSVNVASLVGAGIIREYVIGLDDVDPSPVELARMRDLARAAMEEGALGVATMLIYVPETFAEMPELIALAAEAGKCGGIFAAHMRDEGAGILQSVDEMVAIGRASGAPVHIHHLKQTGAANWGKLGAVIAQVEAARRAGVPITADMYLYIASGTGATAMLPVWVQEGGLEATIARLKDPAVRARAVADMQKPGNMRDPATAMFSSFRNPALRQYSGKRVSEVARLRGTSPAETVIDLIVEDGSRVNTIYFAMSEDNVRRQTALPWMTFGSDAGSHATEGAFLESEVHPRTYGNFARLLGKYVREDKALTLQEAVRKLTSSPASILGIKDRGTLRAGAFADVVIFDPATIEDVSTFEDSHHYARGVSNVWVNGVQVLAEGRHTGAKPGRAVRGRGWRHDGEGGCRASATDWPRAG